MARKTLLVSALLSVLGSCLPAGAVRPITPPAPEFPENAAWINSVPLTMRRLRGKRVVLVTFLNGNNANSIRTLPTLKRWWDRYALNGLMIVGVYDADYGFDRDPIEVRKAIRRLDVKFPVVLDPGRRLWRSYSNEGWPAHFLVDHKGDIIHDRVGEGGYQEFEQEILAALKRVRGYRPPKGYRVPRDAARNECDEATPAFYLGERRGKKILPIRASEIVGIIKARDGEVATRGTWRLESEAARFAGGKDPKAVLRLIYEGAESMAILLPPISGGSGRFYLKQDNAWLHAGNANTDVQWDDEDRSYVEVSAPRLYYLTKNKKSDMHELTLAPDAGLAVAGFEFSDRCQTDYEHR